MEMKPDSHNPTAEDSAAQKYERALEAMREKHAEDLQQCTERLNVLQHSMFDLQRDYQSLRLQKGGFGFKSLLVVGLLSALSGILCCYLFMHFFNPQRRAFNTFSSDYLFHIEYELSKNRPNVARLHFEQAMSDPQLLPMHNSLEAMYSLVQAARTGCDSTRQ